MARCSPPSRRCCSRSPEELLLHADGEVVFDPDWPDEALLDTSTAEHRDRIDGYAFEVCR
ncbi:hypothetical protein [Microbacterium sp. MYb62]|uniref:hypothetical protein n=1 Tax=Microbacterium sp. MYb62 TaxID=1848690 RepID=UPI000CFDD3D9|nr:hypothetical protein [Microbacterium sp. MYb62]PRB14191.1 hypothetical protein CQ042_11965 [Microbacterium sp. MYb62]